MPSSLKDSLKNLTTFAASLLLVAAVAVPAFAGQKQSSCLENLSQGKNRLGVKVSLQGLRKMQSAMSANAKKLKVTDMALFIDYSINSKDKRAYLVDLDACDILAHEYVIHGGTVYKPKIVREGDPNNDGMLDKCINKAGNYKNMTRPGGYVTHGCHVTDEKGWTDLAPQCEGVKLIGLEKRNADAWDAGVVLHEHKLIKNDSSIKLAGQGCPAFPPGKLKPMLKHDLLDGFFVYVYAPQCG